MSEGRRWMDGGQQMIKKRQIKIKRGGMKRGKRGKEGREIKEGWSREVKVNKILKRNK